MGVDRKIQDLYIAARHRQPESLINSLLLAVQYCGSADAPAPLYRRQLFFVASVHLEDPNTTHPMSFQRTIETASDDYIFFEHFGKNRSGLSVLRSATGA